MRSGRSGTSGCVCLILLVLAFPVLADTDLWARMTEQDLSAAREFIAENHPAAVPGHDDPQFAAALNAGYSSAKDLAADVRTYDGYRVVLQRFAAGFRDRHISSRALLEGAQRWPGLLVTLSDDWRVIVNDTPDGPKPGARLLSCDGIAPMELAETRLRPSTSNWDIAAQRKRNSTRLLVDDGDPFVPVPERCTFEDDSGRRVDHELQWRSIGAAELNVQMRLALARPGPAVSLSAFADGWWIRLGTLVDDARPIVDEVVRRADELRSGRFVVVDLRGNGGGSSVYTERIAEVLYGEGRVTSVLKRIAVGSDAATWRASAGNLQTVEQYIERFSRELGADDPLVHELKRTQVAVSQALRDGLPTATVSYERARKVTKRNKSTVKPPRVVLLTDRFCFSSCLMAAHLFRELGAKHVGEETDQNTHYTEVRAITLPSGLSTFSTMQVIDTSHARLIGPFTPSIVYSGRIDDDAAIQAWVAAKVLNQR